MRNSRLAKIIGRLKVESSMTIQHLANEFYVSDMTIRRDLKELESRGYVDVKKGVATLTALAKLDQEIDMQVYSLDMAKTVMVEEKKKIAQFATELICKQEILFLDNGTTTELIAKAIPNNVELTVLTNNYKACQHLVSNEYITLILCGGMYHRDTAMLESKESISLINRSRATKAFISASGIHCNLGVTCTAMYEIDNKQALLKNCKERILVVDSSKFGSIHAYHFAEIEDFDIIITDEAISNTWRNFIKEKEVMLIMV